MRSWSARPAVYRLLGEASFRQRWDAEIDDAYRIWLSRPDLNSFDHSKRRIEISAIFDCFEEDLIEETTIERILVRYGPEKYRESV